VAGVTQYLAGEFVPGNTGHVEVFTGTEEPFDCVADLEDHLAGYAPRPATTTEHRVDAFHIGVQSTA